MTEEEGSGSATPMLKSVMRSKAYRKALCLPWARETGAYCMYDAYWAEVAVQISVVEVCVWRSVRPVDLQDSVRREISRDGKASNLRESAGFECLPSTSAEVDDVPLG